MLRTTTITLRIIRIRSWSLGVLENGNSFDGVDDEVDLASSNPDIDNPALVVVPAISLVAGIESFGRYAFQEVLEVFLFEETENTSTVPTRKDDIGKDKNIVHRSVAVLAFVSSRKPSKAVKAFQADCNRTQVERFQVRSAALKIPFKVAH